MRKVRPRYLYSGVTFHHCDPLSAPHQPALSEKSSAGSRRSRHPIDRRQRQQLRAQSERRAVAIRLLAMEVLVLAARESSDLHLDAILRALQGLLVHCNVRGHQLPSLYRSTDDLSSTHVASPRPIDVLGQLPSVSLWCIHTIVVMCVCCLRGTPRLTVLVVSAGLLLVGPQGASATRRSPARKCA